MAADIFSSTLGVLFMGTGNDNNSWGICFMIVFPTFHKSMTLNDFNGQGRTLFSCPGGSPKRLGNQPRKSEQVR
jgi:hypothetical protein